jgi:hypothetical protein
LAAIFFGHVEQPESKLLGLALETRPHLGLEVGAIHRLHLDRNEFVIHESRYRFFQHHEFGWQIEVHAGPASQFYARVNKSRLNGESNSAASGKPVLRASLTQASIDCYRCVPSARFARCRAGAADALNGEV